jgi:predicted nucleic acid-binding protein
LPKYKGLIHSLRNEMDRLIEAGMWISEIFYHRILLEFGE